MSELLPDGITRLRDAPYNFTQAIKSALMFLSFDELSTEDRPPREIWLDGEALNEHFRDLRNRHRDRTSGREIDDEVRNGAAGMLLVD